MSNTATATVENAHRGEVRTALRPGSDASIVRLAREMAMDHHTLEQLMKRFRLTAEQFNRITNTPRFVALLQSETEAWNAADNTKSRIRLKASATVEEFMLDAYGYMVDPLQPLPGKVKLLDTLIGLGDLTPPPQQQAGPTKDQLVVNISIGDGANDLGMIEAAGLGIAYYGKPVLAAAARARIEHTDLRTALYFQGYSDAEIVGV